MALNGKLRQTQRIITTHNDEGKAIIDTSINSDAPFYSLPQRRSALRTRLRHKRVPRQAHQQRRRLSISTGTILRYVDMCPGHVSPMHRTVSLDYGVVLEGEVELILDSGDKKVLKRGDVCVQRATMHAWRNTSETEWARMLYVLLPSTKPDVGGKELGEDYGNMEGVKASE
ncbi:Cupin 2, conserved barrel [Fusarium oxysporum f. sp. vasinfectum]|nr:Cupin 2, conserved barrel [Fusarium oxysporum f. sp. vasinfectum]